MARENVKARQVGGSLVITLTKPVIEEAKIQEGDTLVVETIGSERIMVRKETAPMMPLKRAELELQILNKRKTALELEMSLAAWEHNNSMPSAHPGIEQAPEIMEGAMKEWSWDLAKIEVDVAEKRLEIFELGGEAN